MTKRLDDQCFEQIVSIDATSLGAFSSWIWINISTEKRSTLVHLIYFSNTAVGTAVLYQAAVTDSK